VDVAAPDSRHRVAVVPGGLSTDDARARLARYGPNTVRPRARRTRLHVLLSQLKSPLLLLLVFAAVASLLSAEFVDATLVITIVVATVAVGYWREAGAEAAAAALQARISTTAHAIRDGIRCRIPIEDIVPGDLVELSAGSLVPGDGRLVEAVDFYVNEAALTGESFPVEKRAAPGSGPADRTARVFLGTNVRSGTARCLVEGTGRRTEFGAIAQRLASRTPETDFDRGTRHFGYLLTVTMLLMVLLVFVAHMFQGHPAASTLLFSVALAVGLSPELLPAILSVNLARGAQALAARGVLVRRLNAIENLGSMTVLCTDKTGTLTEGVVELEGAYGPDGQPDPRVAELGALNAALETGLSNPLDDAILEAHPFDAAGAAKLGEIPFDFARKRVSVIVRDGTGGRLVIKGAFATVIEACTELPGGQPLTGDLREALAARFDAWSGEGLRVLAVAQRTLPFADHYSRDDEHDLVFAGFLAFLDRPKADVEATLGELARIGVSVKIITGDSKAVTQHVAGMVGLRRDRVVTGAELRAAHQEALWRLAPDTDLFVEVDPDQKERIILALKKRKHVVAFLGDGVNDAPAMHAADTSLSVDKAVDVARAAADFVLLEHDLDVIRRGIEQGRRTFANTLKYILTTTSANLGNMLSMAVASLFLPFLPLLPGQILLNNFVSDVPAIGIAGDSVDPEMVDRPGRWNMRFIGRFMVGFGLISSAFDAVTFGVLLWAFRATPDEFRTAWFVESLLTELVIALVVRTWRPFYRSRPGSVLLWTTVALVIVAFATPYVPGAGTIGFVPLPGSLVGTVALITVAYVAATEGTKRLYVGRWHLARSAAEGSAPGEDRRIVSG
jgi:Mg2+-importing ATPase